jgi:hypothetical protein
MVSPQRRRQAVLMLQDRLRLSERRACRYVGQPRSTQRRVPLLGEDDAALRAELKAFSRRRPRRGYRQPACSMTPSSTARASQGTTQPSGLARTQTRRLSSRGGCCSAGAES